MTPNPNAPVPAADDAPVQGFAHCHEAIVAQLRELEQLPELAEAAARARRIAEATADFYRQVVLIHHSEEEQELFSAVLASAERGAERERVQAIVTRLTQDHRHIESLWRTIEPALHDVARGHDAALDRAEAGALRRLVPHARAVRGGGVPAAVPHHPRPQRQPHGRTRHVAARAACDARGFAPLRHAPLKVEPLSAPVPAKKVLNTGSSRAGGPQQRRRSQR